ncbi:ATP-dependent protease subunit HslV [bacterium]|nr:ATP-dependent protease subunit HslV [bacterium]
MKIRATTILGMIHNGTAALGGDGQVTLDTTIVKHHSSKVRKLYNDTVLSGFAGAAADAFALLERFENNLEKFKGDLLRGAVELAQDWRTDRYLRRLDALLTVMNKEHILVLSGQGDIIEPDDSVIAIGSGAGYALAAARAFRIANPKMKTPEIVKRSLEIASAICVYTNENITVLEL